MAAHGDNFDFTSFVQEWMVQQRDLLRQLRRSGGLTPEELRALVDRVFDHYFNFFGAKAQLAQADVFSLFSPTWCTTYERSLLWITGFTPGLVFRVLRRSVPDMSEEQLGRLEAVKEETEYKEKQLSMELALIQESVASDKCVVERTAELGRQLDEATGDVNVVLERMKNRMKVLVHNADYCRMWAGREVVNILNLDQTVRFLIAAGQLQMQVRGMGQRRDAMRGNNG